MAARIDRTLLGMLAEREGSICPSEIARRLRPEGHWRALLPAIREVAARLAGRGEVEIQQGGKRVAPRGASGPIRIVKTAKADHAKAYRGVDFRKHPERYRVGSGEQGVLIAEPYKSELLPLWRLKTPAIARTSARQLWAAFTAYRDAGDFIGADMARKFLQMGFTRARRYANRRSGHKYGSSPAPPDPGKAEATTVFCEAWRRAEHDRRYRAWRASKRT
ncbi:MAG: DUF4385 family protein [Deltaproteobacteria bacterium]